MAALDVSVQASVLNLLADLRRRLGLTLLFVSHDLAVIRHVSDEVIVMYLGGVVEHRGASGIFDDPRHPYTKALLASAPRLKSGAACRGAHRRRASEHAEPSRRLPFRAPLSGGVRPLPVTAAGPD